MNVLFNNNKTGFTMVANKLLCATNLSLKGKAMYAYLCSKPNHWSFSTTRMTSDMKEGKEALNNVLVELEEINLLKRRKIKDAEGKWNGVAYYLNPVDASNLVQEYFRKDQSETTGRTLEMRKDDFRNQCLKVYQEKQPAMSKELAKRFFEYWTETNLNGKKMRFEMQPTFNISMRMDYFIRNEHKNKITPKPKTELQSRNT